MELVGVSEIAELASTTRSAVSNWIARDPTFPRPVASLACGQIWEKRDIDIWLNKNVHSTEDAMSAKENLKPGHIYTHDFICKAFGGDTKSGTYLPQSQQTILCGCFTTTMNPEAPECVLVGSGPRILAKAEKLAKQSGPIPVFLKIGTNQWEYKGRFELAKFSKNPADFETKAITADRNDVVGVLFFHRVADNL